MTFTWNTLDARTGRIEVIDCYTSMEDAIRDMQLWWWEESRPSVDYVTNDDTGAVAAVAMSGAERELFITTYDGRRLEFPMPDSYREVEP